jgi:hypothetical protein
MRALAALLIACSAPAKAPVIDNTAPPAAPPPEVVRTDLATRGLPAASADGTRVVIAERAPDSARGLPNLALMIKERDDFQLERHVVLSVAEADQFLDDADGNNPALDARVARANDWLRVHHAKLRLAPLEVLEPEVGRVRASAARGSLTASWSNSRLRITDGPTTLVDIATPSSWLPEPGVPNTTPCVRTAHLGGAAIDQTKRIAVITISHRGDSDFCLEPPDQNHVITW